MSLEWTPRLVTFLAGVGLYTLATAWTDWRTRRIPNALPVAALLAGLVHQVAFNGWPGLVDGTLGFAVGFGTLFVLWIVGGGGGGDVKLMGGLGMWLGFRGTLLVIVASTAVVVLTAGILSLRKLARSSHPPVPVDGAKEPLDRRRRLPFAVPVAVATWATVAWQLTRITESMPSAAL